MSKAAEADEVGGARPRTKEDVELTTLLTKLYTMQEDVGAKPKTTREDKKKQAQNAGTMGRTRGAKKTGSQFLQLKSSIVDRLRSIHEMLEEEANKSRQSSNPKDVIAAQAEVREQIRLAQEEWRELDSLYKTEARKKRSKFTKEELEVQATLVLKLQSEIEKVRDAQQRGYTRNSGHGDIAPTLNTRILAEIDATDFGGGGAAKNPGSAGGGGGGGGGGGAPGVAATQEQQLQLEQIDRRDADFDRQLDELADGIHDLKDIALQQGEEVKRQNAMLSNLDKKFDAVEDRLATVNSRMKETLAEVRGADKVCVDIMCIVLALGIGAVLYSMIVN